MSQLGPPIDKTAIEQYWVAAQERHLPPVVVSVAVRAFHVTHSFVEQVVALSPITDHTLKYTERVGFQTKSCSLQA